MHVPGGDINPQLRNINVIKAEIDGLFGLLTLHTSNHTKVVIKGVLSLVDLESLFS